jgi:nucleoside-diphosphate-sugar epimerase
MQHVSIDNIVGNVYIGSVHPDHESDLLPKPYDGPSDPADEEFNMKVFLTGATGFIGSALVPELVNSGHQVLGLARSDAGAKSLIAAGAEVHRGDLEDLESLRTGAAQADGVIHAGFIHDFSRFKEVCEIDRRAIETLGAVCTGSDRPLIVTSGLAGLAAPGKLATEDQAVPPDFPLPRVSEQIALALKGVSASVMRLPQVHDPIKQGLVTYLIALAREKGLSAYVAEGRNRWAAAHVSDVARLYRLALEKHEAGAKYHAVAEEGVTLKAIAESIGRGLKIPVVSLSPEEAAAHFGWLTMFAGSDLAASSEKTRKNLGWNPTGPGLIADLDQVKF